MNHLPQLLFYGFGAAIIAASFFGIIELFKKHLTTNKKLALLTVLVGQFIFATFFIIILTVSQKQFTLNPQTLIIAFIAALIGSGATYLHLKAITIEDFSLTLPFLSFTFIFLVPVEFIFFKQVPSNLALIGIVVIIFGTFWLGSQEQKEKNLKWRLGKGSQIMILVAFLYSIWGNLDKAGTLSSSSLGYLLWLNIIIIIFYLIIYQFSRNSKNLSSNLWLGLKNNWLWFLIIGFINSLAAWLLMNAYSTILVNYTISIKRTGLLIPIILGSLLFKEKNLLKRLPGILMMLSGAVIIVIFG
ncbi:EamA family transporter [Patescibacteria group bacterium]|nr:EamA family transporter [Patescibacteria group bacterium]